MNRSLVYGLSILSIVFGVTMIVGSLLMANIFSVSIDDPFFGRVAFMTAAGQTLLFGIASTLAGLALGIYGFVTRRGLPGPLDE